jgi:hypothetical protein
MAWQRPRAPNNYCSAPQKQVLNLQRSYNAETVNFVNSLRECLDFSVNVTCEKTKINITWMYFVEVYRETLLFIIAT